MDERLRVYGTKRLRVVDASISPMTTRGTTQASVYPLAEKAADLIEEDLEGRRRQREIFGPTELESAETRAGLP